MIHIYCSMANRNHELYLLVGSVTTQKLGDIACEVLAKRGPGGVANVDKLPDINDNGDKFYCLTVSHDCEPSQYVNKWGCPVNNRGVRLEDL